MGHAGNTVVRGGCCLSGTLWYEVRGVQIGAYRGAQARPLTSQDNGLSV